MLPFGVASLLRPYSFAPLLPTRIAAFCTL